MTTNFETRAPLRLSGTSPGWLKAVLFLVLACLLVQGTAIQAHQHATPLPGPVATTADAPSSVGVSGKAEIRAVCPLCVEAAMSGHYLQPAATTVPEPQVLVLGVDPKSIPEFRLLSRAVGWLSRAPPQ